MSGYAEYVRHHRRELGLTQDDLAQKLGVARTTIVAIEAGQRKLKLSELEVLQQTGFPNHWSIDDTTEEKTWMHVTEDEKQLVNAYRMGQLERVIRISITKKDSMRHGEPLPFDEVEEHE